MIPVQVAITKRMNELTHIQITLLRNHMGQQGIGRDIEGHAQEQVGAALVELARQLAVGDIELKQTVARRQGHAPLPHVILRTDGLVRQLSRVPGGDDQAPGVGLGANLLDHLADLVNHAAVVALPAAPLLAVDRPQIAVFQRPLIPDADFAFCQPGVVGGTLEEPQEFINDAAQVDLLGRHQRETVLQIETHLAAEHRAGAHAGAITFVESVIDNILHQIEIGFHWTFLR